MLLNLSRTILSPSHQISLPITPVPMTNPSSRSPPYRHSFQHPLWCPFGMTSQLLAHITQYTKNLIWMFNVHISLYVSSLLSDFLPYMSWRSLLARSTTNQNNNNHHNNITTNHNTTRNGSRSGSSSSNNTSWSNPGDDPAE